MPDLVDPVTADDDFFQHPHDLLSRLREESRVHRISLPEDLAMPAGDTTYVFVPGAWHGGWAWQPVADRIRARRPAVTLTLPGLDGNGSPASFRLTDAVDHIVAEIVQRDLKNVTLVAHSWGGYPATAAAHRLPGRISRLVYFNAPIPTPGKSLADQAPGAGDVIRAVIESSADHAMTHTFENSQRLLFNGVAEEVQRMLHSLLVPQPGNYFLDPIELPSATLDVATAYLLSDDDRALDRPGAEYARLLGVEPVIVPGNHDSMLTHPAEVTEALLRITC
jgi:pimeloyl-ACP methyl ester carboxylesterase